MASNNFPSNTPWSTQQQQQQQQQRHDLQHKVSDLSDTPYGGGDSPSGIQGRESLVSLQSYYGALLAVDTGASGSGHAYPSATAASSPLPLPPPSSPSWSAPFKQSPSGAGYTQVAGSSGDGKRNSGLRSFRARAYETIHEDDSIDMSLLKAAAPPGRSTTAYYSPVSTHDPGEPVTYDVTSFAGPPIGFMSDDQAQEASGTLTRGLGRGEVPELIKSDELLAASPTVKRSFSRSFSMRRAAHTPSPRSALRKLGQDEANRRGEVIGVVMEEEGPASDVDISSIVGPSRVGTFSSIDNPQAPRYPASPRQKATTQVFYPQPNWKPFPMRRPYLTFLIVLSVGLAIAQELLYQKSTRAPLLAFRGAAEIKPLYYFVVRFMPTIITVTFGVLWQNTDFEVKRLEAFYQLSKEGGALAAESINVDYITQFSFTIPFRALHRKHYAVAVSSVACMLAISLVPTLGAAVFQLNPDRQARADDPDLEKTITINAAISRALTLVLLAIAALGCFLAHQLDTRRTGLLADVKGIAGLASMAVVSHVLMDFRDMDVAKPKDIHHKLKHRRYMLRNSSLVPVDSASMAAATTQDNSDRYKDAHLPENPHPLMMRKEGYVPFLVGILLFLGFIPAFLFTGARALTERAPWVVTALAVCIKVAWGSLDTDVRMMEPYYLLSRRHAPARTLTLDYTAMPLAVRAFRALFNRHWLVFFVGWGSIMAEGLTIFVTSLSTVEGREFLQAVRGGGGGGGGGGWGGGQPDHRGRRDDGSSSSQEDVFDVGLSGSETVKSFVVSLAIAVFILGYMGATATAVFWRRRHPFLPRQPNTIASVLAFLHQSKMLYDFVGTAGLHGSGDRMAAHLERGGKTYGLGWFDGRDGRTHCGVDEEELTGCYKHGIDYALGNKPWLTEWQLF
ncbi:hypothetical protein SLS62_008346 [Diatrype stigma]|uniref:Uncharacterized protein n=1 Tax=Diatrype stigma TaxID=117547 RepID=A0AAN9YLZ8_9PEZI